MSSSVWYALIDVRSGEPREDGQTADSPPPWKLAVELLRSLTVAAVVACLAARGEIDTAAGGIVLGLALWAGFPLVLLAGSVIWENVAVRAAAVHAGDWLVKLALIGAIVAAWQ